MSDTDCDSINSIPRARAFAEVYDIILELAAEHIESPASVTLDAWEDGCFRIVVYHQRTSDVREALYYHSDGDVVRYGVEREDRLADERVITSLEAGTDS